MAAIDKDAISKSYLDVRDDKSETNWWVEMNSNVLFLETKPAGKTNILLQGYGSLFYSLLDRSAMRLGASKWQEKNDYFLSHFAILLLMFEWAIFFKKGIVRVTSESNFVWAGLTLLMSKFPLKRLTHRLRDYGNNSSIFAVELTDEYLMISGLISLLWANCWSTLEIFL